MRIADCKLQFRPDDIRVFTSHIRINMLKSLIVRHCHEKAKSPKKIAGFTLAELIVVVAMLAILCHHRVPLFVGLSRRRSRIGHPHQYPLRLYRHSRRKCGYRKIDALLRQTRSELFLYRRFGHSHVRWTPHHVAVRRMEPTPNQLFGRKSRLRKTSIE